MDDDYVNCFTFCYNQVDSFPGVDACYSSELAISEAVGGFWCYGQCEKTACGTRRDTTLINGSYFLEVSNCIYDPVANMSTVYYEDLQYECTEMSFDFGYTDIIVLVVFLMVVFMLPVFYNQYVIPKVFTDFYDDLKANVSFQSYSAYQVGNMVVVCTTLFLILFSVIEFTGYLDFYKFILFLSYYVVTCAIIVVMMPWKASFRMDAVKLTVLLNLTITVPHLIFAYCLGGGAESYYSIFYYCWLFLLPLVRFTGRFADDEEKHNSWINGGPAYFKFELANYGE